MISDAAEKKGTFFGIARPVAHLLAHVFDKMSAKLTWELNMEGPVLG